MVLIYYFNELIFNFYNNIALEDFDREYLNYYCFSNFLPYVLVLKILAVCVFAIGTRGTVPRYRLDQLTQLNWKYFIFVWLTFFVIHVGMFVVWI